MNSPHFPKYIFSLKNISLPIFFLLCFMLIQSTNVTPVLASSNYKKKSPKKQKRKRKNVQKLRVLTFNVNYAGVDMRLSLRKIRRSKADLIALQETTPAWESFLKDNLGKEYTYIYFRHSGGAGGMAYLSRYPLLKQKILPPPRKGWFFSWLIKVQTPIGSIQFLNVHLRPPLGDNGRISSAPYAYFYTQGIRKQELQHYEKQFFAKTPLIILGDFNEGDRGKAVKWIKRTRQLRDVLKKTRRQKPTWRWKTSFYTFKGRLDHILYSKSIHCVKAEIMGYSGSDHFPLLAVFRK